MEWWRPESVLLSGRGVALAITVMIVLLLAFLTPRGLNECRKGADDAP